MSLHINQTGVWTPVQKLSVHSGGAFVPVKKAFVNQGGTWHEYYTGSEEPPPEGLKTLIINDSGFGDSGLGTFQTYDVSDVRNDNMIYLDSLDMADIDGKRIKMVVTDAERKIAFVSIFPDGENISRIYALDISDPSDSSGWVIGSLDVEPDTLISFDKMSLDKSKNRLYLAENADNEIYCCDVSIPENMTVLGMYRGLMVSTPLCLDEQKERLYFGTADTLSVLDISDPANIIEIGVYTNSTITPFDDGLALDTERDLLFVGGSYYGFGYVDVSDLTSMEFIILISEEEIISRPIVYDQDSKIIISNTNWDSDGLFVHKIDVSDLANVSFETFTCAYEPSGMAIDTIQKIVYVMYAGTTYQFIALDYSAGISQLSSLVSTMTCEVAALSS